MTYNKVFEVFQDYLSEDKDTEVLNTSRGYLVVMWETSDGDWVTSRLAEDPEDCGICSRSDMWISIASNSQQNMSVTRTKRNGRST